MLLEFVAACLASSLLSLLFIRRAERWRFVDQPGDRKVHTTPTPRTGGLAMWLGLGIAGILLALSRLGRLPSFPWQTWVAGVGFIFIGALDDRYAFHPRKKFGALLGMAMIAAWPWSRAFAASGGIAHWGALSAHIPAVLAMPLLTIWFMAVPNAVNIEDAINGYMGGFTFIVLGAAALLGVDTSLSLGALAGFLVLNWPKAKHFMGDAGSFGCGFLIAESLLRAGGLVRPALALVLTAPISLDILMGIIRRIRLGQSLFDADQATCPHHVLSAFGGSATWASLILWANAAGLFWTRRHPALLALHLTAYCGCLIFLNREHLFTRDAA